MKFISDEEAARRVTPKKDRCVWMEAGILSYLLCDRQFDCDHCPLDEAMRSHYSDLRKRGEEEPAPQREPVTESGDRRYTRNHCWIQPLSGRRCRVGFEPGLGRVLTTLKSLVLPAPGQRISPRMYCAWVIMEGGTLPLRLPVRGNVLRANPDLADRPHLVSLSPTGDGWLFEMELDDREELSPLAHEHEIRPCYETDEESFRRIAGAGLGLQNPLSGMTLQDGGRPFDDLASMIGHVRYITIVKKVFLGHRTRDSQK